MANVSDIKDSAAREVIEDLFRTIQAVGGDFRGLDEHYNKRVGNIEDRLRRIEEHLGLPQGD